MIATRKLLRPIVLTVATIAVMTAMPCDASAKGGGGGRGSSHRTSSSIGKSVHVSGYHRKDGTYVHSHSRSVPGMGHSSSYSSPIVSHVSSPLPVRTESRTAARSEPPYSNRRPDTLASARLPMAAAAIASVPVVAHAMQPTKQTLSSSLKSSNHVWVDHTGTFAIRATFLSDASGLIHLKKASGQIIKIPLEKLSKDDQSYVRDGFN